MLNTAKIKNHFKMAQKLKDAVNKMNIFTDRHQKRETLPSVAVGDQPKSRRFQPTLRTNCMANRVFLLPAGTRYSAWTRQTGVLCANASHLRWACTAGGRRSRCLRRHGIFLDPSSVDPSAMLALHTASKLVDTLGPSTPKMLWQRGRQYLQLKAREKYVVHMRAWCKIALTSQVI